MGLLSESVQRILPKGRFARNVAVLAGGTFASQALMAITTPIATRLYTPADYGILAVFTSMVGVSLVISGGRYELAVTIPEEETAAANLLALSTSLTLLTALASGLAVWVVGDAFLAQINAKGLAPYLWFLPLSIVGSGLYQILSYWAIRTKRFPDVARTKLNQSIGSSVAVLGMGFLHAGPIGLLLGLYVSNSAGATTLVRPLLRDHREALRGIRLSRMMAVLRQYKNFPLLSAPSALLNNAAFFLPPMMISAFWDNQTAGLFGLALKMVGIPGALIGTAVTQVYLAEVAQSARENRRELPRMFQLATAKMLKLSVLVVLFGCLSPYVFGFVFGESWRSAGFYAAFLSVPAAAQLVVAPISTIAIVLQRQDLQMLGDFARCVVVTACFVIPFRLRMSGAAAIAVYAAAMFVTYAGFYLLYRHIAYGVRKSEMFIEEKL